MLAVNTKGSKNRDAKDILNVCANGLSEMKEAIITAFSKTDSLFLKQKISFRQRLENFENNLSCIQMQKNS